MKCNRTPNTTKPGSYEGVPFGEYVKWAAWSKSKLFAGRTLREVRAYCDGTHEPATGPQRLGSLAHARIVEGRPLTGLLEVETVKGPTGRDRQLTTTATAETWHLADEQNDGIVIAPGWVEQIEAMAAAFGANSEAVRLFQDAPNAEVSIVWTDDATGLRCKSRLDRVGPGLVVDLKTTSEQDWERWQTRLAVDFHYDAQAAMYLAAAEAAGFGECEWRFVTVGTFEPYPVIVHEVSEQFLRIGRARLRERMNAVAVAVATNEWPGDPLSVLMDVPGWLAKQYEHALGVM